MVNLIHRSEIFFNHVFKFLIVIFLLYLPFIYVCATNISLFGMMCVWWFFISHVSTLFDILNSDELAQWLTHERKCTSNLCQGRAEPEGHYPCSMPSRSKSHTLAVWDIRQPTTNSYHWSCELSVESTYANATTTTCCDSRVVEESLEVRRSETLPINRV